MAHLMLMLSYFSVNRTAMNENILLVGFAVAGSFSDRANPLSISQSVMPS